MTFRYKKMRILSNSTLFCVAMIGLAVLDEGIAILQPKLIWLLPIGIVTYILVIHGTAVLGKLKINPTGVRIKRVFRPSIDISFENIKSLRLMNDANRPRQYSGELEIRFQAKGVFKVSLRHLRFAETFVRMMHDGFKRAQLERKAEC